MVEALLGVVVVAESFARREWIGSGILERRKGGGGVDDRGMNARCRNGMRNDEVAGKLRKNKF